MGLMRIRLRFLIGRFSRARSPERVFLWQEGTENEAQMEGALMRERALGGRCARCIYVCAF